MTGVPEPLKTDAVGRVRTPAAKRAEILEAFERSGVSGVEFAALVGVKYPTFAAWVQARRGSPAPAFRGAFCGGRGAADGGSRFAGTGAARRSAVAPHGAGPSPAGGGTAALPPAMLSFAGSLKVFVAVDPCDLRKSFDGLHSLVTGRLRESPQTGALFVFTNRRRNRLKILFWDRTGLWVCTKRLEQGTFSWPAPAAAGHAKLSLTPEALTLLTDGVDLRGAKLRPWYQRE